MTLPDAARWVIEREGKLAAIVRLTPRRGTATRRPITLKASPNQPRFLDAGLDVRVKKGIAKLRVRCAKRCTGTVTLSVNGKRVGHGPIRNGVVKVRVSKRGTAVAQVQDEAGHRDPDLRREPMIVAMLAALALAGPSGPTSDNTPTFTWEGENATCAVDGGDARAVHLPGDPEHAGRRPAQLRGHRGRRASRAHVPRRHRGAGLTLEGAAFTAEDGADTRCAVDDAPAEPCTSPFAPALKNGSHALHIIATDAAGNRTTRTRIVQVEVAAPETSITAGPTGETEDAQPLFAFAGGAAYVCTLDGVAVECGPSFQPAAALAAGEHTLTVAARDAAGNLDPSPAQRTFTVVPARRA